MASIPVRPARPRSTFIGQLGLSITASVAATLIVSIIQHETAGYRAAAPAVPPSLTRGGKFAARVEALRSADSDTDHDLPDVPRVPLLAADAALQAVPIHLVQDSDFGASRPVLDGGRPTKHVTRADIRRHASTEAAAAVLPPRRSDSLVLAADSTADSPAHDSEGVWTTTTSLYHQAVAVGGSMFDHVNPLRLLP